MVGVPWNVRVALRSVRVEGNQQAQPNGKKREQKGCNPRRDDANRSGSQQEKTPDENDDCWQSEQKKVRRGNG